MSMVEKRFIAPIIKSNKGTVQVILSDTSEDRDEEIIGKSFLDQMASADGLPALMDHENKALNLVAEWINKRVEKRMINGEAHFALVAEPKFFMSNPNARIIHDMIVKDGAKMGVSITAIPHDSDIVQKGGRNLTRYTSGEALSADFVGIQSNRNAKAALVKAYESVSVFSKDNKDDEVVLVDKEVIAEIKKGVGEAFNEAFANVKDDLAKNNDLKEAIEKMAALDKRLEALEKSAEEAVEGSEEESNEDGAEVDKSKAVELAKKEKEREEVLAKLRSTPSADSVQTAVVADDKVGVQSFIKAYNMPKAQE